MIQLYFSIRHIEMLGNYPYGPAEPHPFLDYRADNLALRGNGHIYLINKISIYDLVNITDLSQDRNAAYFSGLRIIKKTDGSYSQVRVGSDLIQESQTHFPGADYKHIAIGISLLNKIPDIYSLQRSPDG